MSDPTQTPPAPPAPPAAPAPYLAGLNETQAQAVAAVDGPVLVLAGAGTGKTRVLTTRLAHILMQRKARPWEVLAVTFTNKAAREMKERIGLLVGGAVEGMPWLGTFHSIGVKIIRRHAELAGLKSDFSILDTDDVIRLIKQLIQAEGIDDKRWPARQFAQLIDGWKNKGLAPSEIPEGDSRAFANGKGRALYTAYQNRLQTLNACDFGDLLLLCLELFRSAPEVLAKYQRQFRYIMVDEYQDTNVAQYLWLRLLAQAHKNICCVGDDDQSIYSWRGAEVGNILRFEKDFPGATVVRLERNYRSTSHILAAASGLIAHNDGRLGKTLWTEQNDGDPVVVRGVWDGDEEARVIGDEIESLHGGGHKLNEIAVLVRAGFQTREFEERLITLGVPYRVVGGQRFYERQEIRDAIAYLRVIAQPADDLAFERIVNLPKRGLGDATLQAVHLHARARGLPLVAAAREICGTDELKPKARQTLTQLIDDFDRWRALVSVTDHVDVVKTVLDESGYMQMWQESKAPEASGRRENLKELVVALEDFDNLAGFLEHVSLVMENEENATDDKVSLMTLHGAKGLEFETVFLPGWEEGLFPHQRALDEGGLAALEEERRLAYVGLTRARKRAAISFAANRRVYGQWQTALPSRFVDELPNDNISRQQEQGLYSGSGYGGLGNGGYDGGTSFPGALRRSGPRASRFAGGGNAGGSDAWRAADRGGADDSLTVGTRVFHQKFGYGRIKAKDGDKLEIEFEKAGRKKVMGSFVESVS